MFQKRHPTRFSWSSPHHHLNRLITGQHSKLRSSQYRRSFGEVPSTSWVHGYCRRSSTLIWDSKTLAHSECEEVTLCQHHWKPRQYTKKDSHSDIHVNEYKWADADDPSIHCYTLTWSDCMRAWTHCLHSCQKFPANNISFVSEVLFCGYPAQQPKSVIRILIHRQYLSVA